jgi:hypothetical protein
MDRERQKAHITSKDRIQKRLDAMIDTHIDTLAGAIDRKLDKEYTEIQEDIHQVPKLG